MAKDTAQLNKWLVELRDDDWTNRWMAARRLRRFNDKQTFAALMRALDDKNWVVRWEITEILGEIGDASLVPPLIDLLLGIPTYLRINAAWILGKIGDPRAVEPLIRALEDPNWFGRAKAARALGEIGDWRAIKVLVKACHDIEESVQDAARDALEMLYASVKTVVFGEGHLPITDAWPVWQNPEATELTTPLSGLKIIGIHVPTHDFHRVEQFLTYAVNYIGQKHLKAHVIVHIYGEPARLHPNLLNTLTNLCKSVKMEKLVM
jgi:hypothetical protein